VSRTSTTETAVQMEKGEGRSFWLLRDLHTFKITGDETGGAMTVAELVADPELAPPPHVHLRADESFYVLEGTFDFMLAGRRFTAGPGAFVHLPRGVVHQHGAGCGAPARALVIQSPSGVEAFIAEAGQPCTSATASPSSPTPDDFVRIVAIARTHGIEVPTS